MRNLVRLPARCACHLSIARREEERAIPRRSFKWFLTAAAFVTASTVSQTVDAQATPINLGDLVASEIAVPCEADTIEFDAIAGQIVFLDRTASSNPKGLNWKLKDRFGRVLICNFGALNDMGLVALIGESNARPLQMRRSGTRSVEGIHAE